ncbi:MAG: heme-binding domain-containing protein [Acidobacteriota bacterium]
MGRRLLKWLAALLAAGLLAIQFHRPPRTNPPADPALGLETRMAVPAEVRRILRRSCYDCHSQETRWPWYSQVAPVSWFLAGHVRDARSQMNFSVWPDPADPGERMDADYLLKKICEMVKEDRMPLPSYRWMHWSAPLSPGEVDTVCAWSRKARASLYGGG